MREEELWRRQTEELRQKRDKHQRGGRRGHAPGQSVGRSVCPGQNEWTESLYSWAGKNQELKLSPETLKEMAAFVKKLW